MQKLITTFIFTFIVVYSFGQKQKRVSTYLMSQYNKTIYDATKGNNPWGIGLGLQTILITKSKFKPTIELTGDIYLEDDKVYRTNINGAVINDIRSMVNLFAGTCFSPSQSIYLSFVAGPSFINGQTMLGIKPSFGFYFSTSQKWSGKISYINILNRDKATQQDFSSLSLAVGLKLY